MDESLKEAIATSVAAALKNAPNGLTDAELLEAVDDCESLADLRRVLGEMKRGGTVTQMAKSKRWSATVAGVAGQQPGEMTPPPPPPKSPDRHPCAKAVLDALAASPGLRSGEMETHPAFNGEYGRATIGYHVKQLIKAGLVQAGEHRLAGYTLTNGAPIAPRAAKAEKAPRKKASRRKAPKTARLSDAAERAAKPEQPLQLAPAPVGGVSITMRCPAGELTLTGSRALVFGFLDQLKAMAA